MKRQDILITTVFLFASTLTVPAMAQDIVVPSSVQEFAGTISATTTPDGMATIISVPSHEKKKPLLAGFVIQYDPQTTSPINFITKGRLTYSEVQPIEQPLALSIKTDTGQCWTFKVDIYGGQVPDGCQMVGRIAGIAHYWWTKTSKEFPRTHKEFVEQQEASLKNILPSGSSKLVK